MTGVEGAKQHPDDTRVTSHPSAPPVSEPSASSQAAGQIQQPQGHNADKGTFKPPNWAGATVTAAANTFGLAVGGFCCGVASVFTVPVLKLVNLVSDGKKTESGKQDDASNAENSSKVTEKQNGAIDKTYQPKSSSRLEACKHFLGMPLLMLKKCENAIEDVNASHVRKEYGKAVEELLTGKHTVEQELAYLKEIIQKKEKKELTSISNIFVLRDILINQPESTNPNVESLRKGTLALLEDELVKRTHPIKEQDFREINKDKVENVGQAKDKMKLISEQVKKLKDVQVSSAGRDYRNHNDPFEYKTAYMSLLAAKCVQMEKLIEKLEREMKSLTNDAEFPAGSTDDLEVLSYLADVVLGAYTDIDTSIPAGKENDLQEIAKAIEMCNIKIKSNEKFRKLAALHSEIEDNKKPQGLERDIEKFDIRIAHFRAKRDELKARLLPHSSGYNEAVKRVSNGATVSNELENLKTNIRNIKYLNELYILKDTLASEKDGKNGNVNMLRKGMIDILEREIEACIKIRQADLDKLSGTVTTAGGAKERIGMIRQQLPKLERRAQDYSFGDYKPGSSIGHSIFTYEFAVMNDKISVIESRIEGLKDGEQLSKKDKEDLEALSERAHCILGACLDTTIPDDKLNDREAIESAIKKYDVKIAQNRKFREMVEKDCKDLAQKPVSLDSDLAKISARIAELEKERFELKARLDSPQQ